MSTAQIARVNECLNVGLSYIEKRAIDCGDGGYYSEQMEAQKAEKEMRYGLTLLDSLLRNLENEITARIKGDIIRQCEAGAHETDEISECAPPAQPLKVVR